MIDPFRIQEDNYLALLSAGQFASVNIVNQRRFMLRSDLEQDAVWSTVRNGRSGNGILVEELLIDASPGYENAPAPILDITFPMVCFQNGDAALLKDTGSGFTAQNLAMMVLDLFFQWSTRNGMMTLHGRCWERANDFGPIEAIRVSPKVRIAPGAMTQPMALITATNVGREVTLNCATPGATIVYTLDGSFPANPNFAFDPLNVTAEFPNGSPANPAATVYNGPFNLPVGITGLAIAYAENFKMSPLMTFSF